MHRSFHLLSRTGVFVTIAFTLLACMPITPSTLRPPLPPASGLLAPKMVASPADTAQESFSPAAVSLPTVAVLPTPTPQPPDLPVTLDGPVTVAIDPAVPEDLAAPIHVALARTQEVNAANGPQPLVVVDQPENAGAEIRLGTQSTPGQALVERYLAVVAPFDTVTDDIALADVQARWQGSAPIFASEEAARLLSLVWGAGAAQVVPLDQMSALLEADRNALGIVSFEQIDPRFKVLTVDGANVLSNELQPGQYPLVVQAKVDGVGAALVAPALQGAIQYGTNRDPSKLTTLIMTGVTAMARGTAARMEQKGYTYPAEIIGPTLATADITHVSNEIPFLDDCRVNNTENNLVLCSDTTYWAALEAIGTDIVGLSGNHVNDFGRDGARRSLQWYKDNQIPIYGSGLTIDEACAPLLWEHNGNTFAFIAALAFDPPGAWVTETEPGACYYYDHKDRIINTINDLKEKVDVVAVELQYEETYFPYPTGNQVVEFRELRAAGADIVTGVQSHVPQAQEPYGAFDAGGPGMISYGLGNLFFDQMWSWATRTELMARHAIYNGRLLNTEILTAVLEDYAQPRWTTPAERVDLLSTIFAGAPPRP
jgi:hypothetical protein